MDRVYTQGIWMAELLQSHTRNYQSFWLLATHMGDPKAAFLLIFPSVFYLHRRTGIAILWVASVSEWLNLVFKWVLFGERPYWWIGQSGLFVKNSPMVQQFQSTCETGPGSPSGHAMVTAAVWWVVASALASFLHSRFGSKVIAAIPYIFYMLLLGAVGLSRVFILAHFPHQVIAGVLTGIMLGVILNRTVPDCRSLLFFLCSSMALIFGALLMHAGMKLAGIDLAWSIALAKRWCSQPDWIRMDTNPFSSLSRDAGALLGLGLAQFWKPGGWALSWVPKTLCMALSSMALYHVVMVMVPGLVHLLTAKPKRE